MISKQQNPPTLSDSSALDAIARILAETQDWDADTIDAVAELVRATGRLALESPE